MKTFNQIVIHAPVKTVFDTAERIVEWPKFLPHYRWVTIFSEEGRTRHVEMAAFRDGFPCKWRSEQVLYPSKNLVYFRHTRSFWSQGMEVWWILKPLKGGATEVTITHDMPPAGNLPLAWFRQHVVGDFFVAHNADKTLLNMK